MRALVYCRVSTEEQAEHGFSLAAQEQMCRERAADDGLPVAEVYIDDGYSAATLERPALQRLLRDAREGDTVYCYRLDRLSRDVEHMAALMRAFQTKNATVKPLVGAADLGTSIGRAFVGIQSVFAQLEREQLSERVKVGLRQRIESGKPYPARPYGFVPKVEEWRVNPEQAEVVRQIARWRLAGAGLHTICRRLDEMGVKPPGQGQHWHSWSVAQILSNPIYAGHLRYKGEIIENAVPAILDQETWERLQVLNQARRRTRTWERTDYLLSGLIWCQCGARMGPYRHQVRRKNGKAYELPSYRCVARSGRPSVGHTNTVNGRDLDRLVLEHLDSLAQGDDSSLVELPPPPRVDVSARLAALEREIEALEIHLLQGRIPPDRFDRHKERIETARQEILEMAAHQQNEAEYRKRIAARVKALAGNLSEQYEREGVTPALKAAVQQLVDRIEVSFSDGSRRGLASRTVRIRLRPLSVE